MSGNLFITTNHGAITQDAPLTVNGTSSFTAGTALINLPLNNTFTNAVSLFNSGANNIAITTSGALLVGRSSIGTGTLTLTSGGSMSQNDSIIQEANALGITLKTTAANSDIDFSTAANNFTGSIAFDGTILNNIHDVGLRNINAGANLIQNLTAVTELNNLTLIFDAAGISFPTLRMSGHLNVTAGGNITETGTLTMTGALKVASMNTGSHDITLENNNDFDTINITAHDVNINDINALTLGSSNISGNLIVNTHGLLTQSNGTNIIANQPNTITSLSANGGNIILDAATNDFNTIQISANQASIRDINTIDLGSSIVADTFNIVANQNITQSAALIISGAAFFTAGSDITLNNSNNDFSSISMSGHDVYVQDKNALTLNASSLTGNLTILTNGDISQNGALVVPGAASFIANAHAITLNDANNQLSGAVALSNAGNHNVALSNNGSLLLAASSLGSGTLDLTATSISQNGAIIEEANAGITTINANDGAIALTDSNNLFTGTVKLNNRGDNNVALTNDGALTIGTSNIGSGTLALNWRGTLNETGAITQESQAKTITLTANAPQSDLLLSAANDLNSNIIIGSPQYINDFNLHNINQNASLPLNLDSLTNLRDLTLTFDAAGISFPTLRMSGHLNVTAGGNITETGTLTMTGALKIASMNTGSHDITLENDNDFDTINITAHDVNINDLNALTLGSSNISGNLIVNTHGHILLTGNLDMFGSQKTAIFNANNNDITLNASINGAIDLALNAGLSNDIFVNADLGDTARLRTITIDPHNFISNATIRVTSFIQNEGTGITLFNHGGLDATEGASLVPNSLNGNIKVTSLTFNIDTGNMFGTVNGL